MSTDHTHDSADSDVARRQPHHESNPAFANLNSHATSTDERIDYPARLLKFPSLRGYGNSQPHASVMRNMQQTYGNLNTRRAVQRAVTINDYFSGVVSSESNDEKKRRQFDMTEEEKVKEMTDQTDQLDENWAGMGGQDRQRMTESQNEHTREEIDMQAAERGTPEDYARCPDPSKSNCGFGSDPNESPIPELEF